MSNESTDDCTAEQLDAEDRRADRECQSAAHIEDTELAAYYANLDRERDERLARPVSVSVRRRIAVDARYFEGVTKQLGAVMALFGSAK